MFLTLSNLTGLSLHPLAASVESDKDSDAGSYTEMAPSSSKDSMQANSGSESENSSEKMKPHKKRRKLDSGSKKESGEEDGMIEEKSENGDESKGIKYSCQDNLMA